ncbi:MAG: ABC transporter ATP-binding protein, partial [Pseudomonadota bacterium]|nr:ABC transporter ATP-binding protein [Pseudomonadota bacterium]
MARLDVEELSKGWDFPVIDRLSFSVEEGEFFVVVGPSGIGKTTLLRLISGLETPDAGRVLVAGKDQTKLPPYRRRIAMTFESYALYPHLSVYQNIASPLKARGMEASAIDRKVRDVAVLLRIEGLLDSRPGEISGGQKQRTALGRTLVADPEVFLLDEPISHLDARIRHELRTQFHILEDLRKVATVYVTHDYAEALSLGDRIAVMGNGGRFAQTGTPRELFESPASLFVAEHLGQPTINAIPSILVQSGDRLSVRATKGSFEIAVPKAQAARLRAAGTSKVILGLRPQHLRPADESAGGKRLPAKVDLFEALGSTGVMIADVGGTRLTALTGPERHFRPGDDVMLSVRDGSLYYFE